jgi:hypothetical protein
MVDLLPELAPEDWRTYAAEIEALGWPLDDNFALLARDRRLPSRAVMRALGALERALAKLVAAGIRDEVEGSCRLADGRHERLTTTHWRAIDAAAKVIYGRLRLVRMIDLRLDRILDMRFDSVGPGSPFMLPDPLIFSGVDVALVAPPAVAAIPAPSPRGRKPTRQPVKAEIVAAPRALKILGDPTRRPPRGKRISAIARTIQQALAGEHEADPQITPYSFETLRKAVGPTIATWEQAPPDE